ncbi:MAG: hypothetical protein ACJ8F7_03225 [Gemmataceae bacterium]
MAKKDKNVQGHPSVNRHSLTVSHLALVDIDGGLDESKLSVTKIVDEMGNDWTKDNKIVPNASNKKKGARVCLRIKAPNGIENFKKDNADPPDTGTILVTLSLDGGTTTFDTDPVQVNYANDNGM